MGNIYYAPDADLILSFMKTYMPNFDASLGYKKWHYVKGFTKNCEYKSDEYYADVKLMKKLEKSVYEFQNKCYSNCDLSDITDNKKIKLADKPTIFLYWHQGKSELPELQLLCYKRLLQQCSGNFNILLLDNETVNEYIDIPDSITSAMLEKRMWIQHYVDYIRLALLAKYEGIWLDATIFVRNDLSNINFESQFWSIKTNNMYGDTWAKNVIPEMNNCQIYAMGGTSSYFYNCMLKLIEYHFNTFEVAYSYYMMYYIAQYLYETNIKIRQQFDSLSYNNENVECFANNRSLPTATIIDLWNNNIDTSLFKLIKFKTDDDDAYKVYTFLKSVYENDR